MFIPSTHLGLTEAVIQTLLRRKGDNIRQLGLNENEAAEVARFLMAKERIRRAEPYRGPRSSRSIPRRMPDVSDQERKLAQTPPDVIQRISRSRTAFWDALDGAWDLLRDDLVCGRIVAEGFYTGRRAPIAATEWMEEANNDAHILGTLAYTTNWLNVGEAPIMIARAALSAVNAQAVAPMTIEHVAVVTPLGQSPNREASGKTDRSTPRSDYAADLINRAFGTDWPAPGSHKPGEVVSRVLAKAQSGDRQVAPSRKTILKRLGWQKG